MSLVHPRYQAGFQVGMRAGCERGVHLALGAIKAASGTLTDVDFDCAPGLGRAIEVIENLIDKGITNEDRNLPVQRLGVER